MSDTCELRDATCKPCRGGVPPLRGEPLRELVRRLGNGWDVIEDHHLHRTFLFPDFRQALAFTNTIGNIAEKQGHHPDIALSWGEVGVTICTHKINGLSESDFILAAKIGAA